MSYCSGGKMWCLPSDLLNHELEHFIDLLWANFAFDNGAYMVHDMLLACEQEIRDRKALKSSRNLAYWTRIGWPKRGTPVIEYTFETDEATVVIFDWPLEKTEAITEVHRREREDIQCDEEGL